MNTIGLHAKKDCHFLKGKNKMPDNSNLHGLRVAILATDGYEEAELVEPRKALDAAGAKTSVIAPKTGKLQGMKHDEKAGTVNVDQSLEQANPAEFDAVLLLGGALNADALRMNKAAQAFVKHIDAQHKPIAVICHGPWLLVSAGLALDRSLTSYFTIQDDLRNAGATWVDQEVVQDKNWVSSRKPDDIPAFNKKMLSLFAESKARAKGA
jgi:protease I